MCRSATGSRRLAVVAAAGALALATAPTTAASASQEATDLTGPGDLEATLDDVPGEYLADPDGAGFRLDLTGAVVDLVATVEQITGEGELIVADDGETLTFGADVFFAFDEAELTPAARDTLAGLADDIRRRANAAGAMHVVGHTDAVGDPGYNQQLSHARAQAVADHLERELGLSGVDLTVEGRGENEPIAANETEDGEDNPEGRARNRRVELHFEAPDR